MKVKLWPVLERLFFMAVIGTICISAIYGQVSLPSRTIVTASITVNADKSRTLTWPAVSGANRYILLRYANAPNGGLGGDDLPVNTDLQVCATLDKTLTTYTDPFQVPKVASSDVHYLVIAE